jgi:hypothetical protein
MVGKELVIDGNGVTTHAGFRTRAENFVTVNYFIIHTLFVAVQKVKQAAARTQSMYNLKMIILAMHDYQNVHATLPSGAIYSKDGKPLLSWRVALLPYLDELGLYKQFKLDEPWNSPHNLKLLKKMPKKYAPPDERASPGTSSPGGYLTYYRVFVGLNTPFLGRFPPRLPATFQDGVSNTILVVEAGEAVPWTKPDELPLPVAPTKPLPKLGGVRPNDPVFCVALADGSVRSLPRSIPERTLRALITPSGGEVIDWDAIEGKKKPGAAPPPDRRK